MPCLKCQRVWQARSVSSDRYLIGILLGAAAVGYYSPGYSLGGAIGMLYAPFVIFLPPVVSKYRDERNIDDVSKVLEYSRVKRYN